MSSRGEPGIVADMHATPPGSEPADLSPYDRLLHSNEQIEQWLAQGLHARELIAYLGEAEYALLAPLARAAAAARSDSRLEVIIVPGFMGTQLGRPRPAPWPANLMWIDPVDIQFGRLSELRLSDTAPLQCLGAITYTHLALKLRLSAAGLQVRFHEYDWRLGIAGLGVQLAQRIAASNAERVVLVAHSMGGLVARAALLAHSTQSTTLITLGTPHAGTLAPVQALRGTYPTVRRVAALDRVHSAEQLTQSVFGKFPSLYDMLPAAAIINGLDLFDARNWPQGSLRPDESLLSSARRLQQSLSAGDMRHHCILGTGVRTATGVRLAADDFEYEISSDGDGTVPAASASLSGLEVRSCRCEHSELPRSAEVAAAIIELILDGHTSRLSAGWHTSQDAHVQVTDRMLRETYTTKLDWRLLSADERRLYLNQLNLAPPHYAVAAEPLPTVS